LDWGLALGITRKRIVNVNPAAIFRLSTCVGITGPSLEARHPTHDAYIANVRAATREVDAGFLPSEDVERTVKENVGLYDWIMARDPKDQECRHLFGQCDNVPANTKSSLQLCLFRRFCKNEVSGIGYLGR
jgi:hypothetical protein